MNRKKRFRIPKEIVAILIAILMLSPLYLIFVNSFKSRQQIFNNPITFERDQDVSLFYYYKEAMEKMDFYSALSNSLIITVISVLLIGLFASMLAWVLVRSNKKVNKFIFGVLVISMLVPFQTVMIPLKQLMDNIQISGTPFHMLNSRYGLIFMYIGFGLPLGTFLFHSFIKNIPVELEEAAIIDGLSSTQTFFKIVAPLLKPIYFTVAILNTLWIWNDFLLPSLVLSDKNLRTIPLSTFYFFGEFTIEWNFALAALVLTVIPVVIFYAIAQKYIIKGVTSGAVK